MKTLLLTGYDDAFAPLGDLTAPLMLAYASRHGYDFQCYRDCSQRGVEASWHKIGATLAALANYGRVIWLDADQVVTNPEITHTMNANGFHASLDWGHDATEPGHFSAGGFIAYRNASAFLTEVLGYKSACLAVGEYEQTPMRELHEKHKFSITIHPRRTFCAVPDEVSPGVAEPWQLGDWCAHLTMIALAERVSIFNKINWRRLRGPDKP